MPFAISISVLGLVQAALVALPAPGLRLPWLGRLRSRWWGLAPAGSIVVVLGAIELGSGSAAALSYLALVAVPPLAAAALGWLVHGAQPSWALVAVPLFALAWAAKGSLGGEAAAMALSGLACISLGWLLVSVVPAYWLRLGVYAMAAIDAAYVSADLLQAPNAVLSAAAPGGGLPRLQVVHFGHAQMGFGDLFVAALVGCLLASTSQAKQLAKGPRSAAWPWISAPWQQIGAALVAVLALAFDLLFFAVDELPSTVPVAVALALVTWWERRGRVEEAQL